MAVTRMALLNFDIDAIEDSAYAYGATVMAARFGDNAGNQWHVLVNVSGTTINPDSVATYDAAPFGSVFVDAVVSGKIYLKTATDGWTAQT